jgi:chemotaxis protein histidine kinase CheA
VSRRKKNECKAEGAPSTEILTEANLVRVETAGQQLVDLVGEAKLGTYRFCSVIKFATGVLNEDDEETFMNRYCELNENGNLKHFPSDVVDKLRAAYFDQCDKAKISEAQRKKARTKKKFAEVLGILQVGRKAFYICRNDKYRFDKEMNTFTLSDPQHWLYKALIYRCNDSEAFWAAKRFTLNWDSQFDDDLVTLKDLLEWKKGLAAAEKALAEEKAAAAAEAEKAAAAAAEAEKAAAAAAEAEKAAAAAPEAETAAAAASEAEKAAAAAAEAEKAAAAAAEAEKAAAAATAATNKVTTRLQSAKAKAASGLEGSPSEEEPPSSKRTIDPSSEASAMKFHKASAEEPKLEIEVFDLPPSFGWAQLTDGGALLWEGDQCKCQLVR